MLDVAAEVGVATRLALVVMALLEAGRIATLLEEVVVVTGKTSELVKVEVMKVDNWDVERTAEVVLWRMSDK